jgi:hypothetical protein
MQPMLLVTINPMGMVFVTKINSEIDEELDTVDCAVRVLHAMQEHGFAVQQMLVVDTSSALRATSVPSSRRRRPSDLSIARRLATSAGRFAWMSLITATRRIICCRAAPPPRLQPTPGGVDRNGFLGHQVASRGARPSRLPRPAARRCSEERPGRLTTRAPRASRL